MGFEYRTLREPRSFHRASPIGQIFQREWVRFGPERGNPALTGTWGVDQHRGARVASRSALLPPRPFDRSVLLVLSTRRFAVLRRLVGAAAAPQ